jgi:hypothetical protein
LVDQQFHQLSLLLEGGGLQASSYLHAELFNRGSNLFELAALAGLGLDLLALHLQTRELLTQFAPLALKLRQLDDLAQVGGE